MNKKNITFIIVLLGFTLNAQFRTKDRTENLVEFDSQDFSWGYYLGINMFTFKMHPSKIGLTESHTFTTVTEPKLGFSAGLMGRRRLNDHFDARLEPSIHFSQRNMIFAHVRNLIGEEIDDYPVKPTDTIRTIKSTYLDIPIFLNFHGNRYYNTRPYIQAGVSWAINLQSNESKKEDNQQGIFRTKTHNFTYQAEMGVEIYFKRFKLTPSVRGIFFFNNELVPDNPDTPDIWAGSLKAIYTRAVMFSLKFE